MRRLLGVLALAALLGAGLSDGYLTQEKAMHERETALQRLGVSLDDWLSGRSSHHGLQEEVARLKGRLGPNAGPSGKFGQELSRIDLATLAEIERFLQRQTPTSEQQRQLFQRLGELSGARQRLCLEQRQQSDLGELKGAESETLRFLRWELSWIELWQRETELTARLQSALLQESGSAHEASSLVGDLLRLQAKAESVAAPQELVPLQELSLERLTLLARTAEQATRKQGSDARGALLQIRRLGRQLDENAERFRTARMDRLTRLAR